MAWKVYRYKISNYDYIYLYDGDGVQKAQYSATNKYNVWSVEIPGDTVQVRLKKENSVLAETTIDFTTVALMAAFATLGGNSIVIGLLICLTEELYDNGGVYCEG